MEYPFHCLEETTEIVRDEKIKIHLTVSNFQIFSSKPLIGREPPAFSSQIAHVAYLLAGFLKDMGHPEVTEEIMMALNDKFDKVIV